MLTLAGVTKVVSGCAIGITLFTTAASPHPRPIRWGYLYAVRAYEDQTKQWGCTVYSPVLSDESVSIGEWKTRFLKEWQEEVNSNKMDKRCVPGDEATRSSIAGDVWTESSFNEAVVARRKIMEYKNPNIKKPVDVYELDALDQ